MRAWKNKRYTRMNQDFHSNDVLCRSLNENENRLRSIFSSCSDIVILTIKIFGTKRFY